MDKLPPYLVYRKTGEHSEIQVRKIKGDKDAGIRVSEKLYDFPGEAHAETFINRKNAIELIQSLMEYFGIRPSDL